VTVTPTDGHLDGPPATASVVIGNGPPTAPVLHIEPAAPEAGDPLTLVYDTLATDPDGDTLTTSITWYVDGSENLGFRDLTDIDGAYVDGNEVYRAVVSVTDGVNTPVTAEATVTVANTPPTLTTPSINPPTPNDDDDLVVSARGNDPDGGRVSYRYTWYRDGIEATDVGDTNTVPASATTVGESWTATVSASDGVDETSDSAAAVVIEDWQGYTYTQTFTTTLVNDGTGAYPTSTGTWSYGLLSQGGWMGDNDCDLQWDIDATSAPGVCPRCDYAFSVEYTLDTSASTGTGATCVADMADGIGTWSFRTARDAIQAYNYPFGSATMGYYGYYYYGGLSLYAQGSGGYTSSYYGYTWTHYYSVTSTEDSAGNITIQAYDYQSSRY
jgi:hypothetical protein